MKALLTIVFLVLFCFGSRAYGAGMATLTNFNAVYFLVDADPTAIPTNVVLLSGNITNWQKITTNMIIKINPSDNFIPYRFDATTFADSILYVPASTEVRVPLGKTLSFEGTNFAGAFKYATMNGQLGGTGGLLIGGDSEIIVQPMSNQFRFGVDGSLIDGTNTILGGVLGWSGTGANFLSDDGTYRAAGSGPSSAANWIGSGTTDSKLVGIASVGRITATNGTIHQFKPSFSTNYSIGSATNQQFFLLNGTNQLITLPAAAGVQGIIYRFSMTNGWGSFILTNAADGAKVRDGTSSSYTNIGINEVGMLSDGSNWWLASKGKQIFPAASWSLNATISPVQDVITNLPFDQLEFNNSQGIALKTNALFAKPTQLWITNSGTYLITFSAVLKGSAGGSKLSIWLRKDGSNVARTRTDQGFSGATAQQCMTVNYFVSVGAPCFYELVAASHDATPPSIEYGAANPTGYTAPAMPSIIVTINRVSDTWP